MSPHLRSFVVALTLAVPVVAQGQGQLVTSFKSDATYHGFMFDVEAKSDITICYLWVDMNRGSHDLRLYSKAGSYEGFEQQPAAWTLVADLAAVKSAGESAPTVLPVELSQPIQAGQTRAFYLLSAEPGSEFLRADFSRTEGSLAAENGDLKLYAGAKLSLPFALVPGGGTTPNIIIQYASLGLTCEAVLPLVTLPTNVSDDPGGGGPLVAGNVYELSPTLGFATVPAGKTLTVEPGAIVKLGVSAVTASSLVVRGILNAEGLFTSIDDPNLGGNTSRRVPARAPQPGDWDSIRTRAGGQINLDGATAAFGGRSSGFAAVSLDGSNGSSVYDSYFSDTGTGNGFVLEYGSSTNAEVQNNLFENNVSAVAGNLALIDLPKFVGNQATNNGGDWVEVQGASSLGGNPITQDVDITRLNALLDTIFVNGSFTVGSGTTLCIEEGVNIKFRPGQNGGITALAGSRLEIAGQPGSPVKLTSIFDDTVGSVVPGGTPPTPGDWLKLDLREGSSVDIKHAVFKFADVGIEYFTAFGIIESVTLTNAARAMVLDTSGSPMTNFVVDGSQSDGILLQGGTIDLIHVTVANCQGAGLRRTSQWTGSVRNSNVWNNLGGNYEAFNGLEVLHSNGGFAGVNSNLDTDPQFASGTLKLGPSSPLIDAGDLSHLPPGLALDRDGAPRVQSFRPDMGAFEYKAARLVRTGEFRAGAQLGLQIQSGISTGVVVHAFGFGTLAFQIPGLGTLAVGNPALLVASPPLVLPGAISLTLPGNVSNYMLATQPVIVPLGAGAGPAFLGNVERATVAPPQ